MKSKHQRIKLTKGQVTIIDQSDIKLISNHSWCAHMVREGLYYAAARIKGKLVHLHRFLLKAEKGQIVDHINGDTLDNRRSNLRLVTSNQNHQNSRIYRRADKTSKFKGVSFSKPRGKWIAHIYNGGSKYLGIFTDESDAAKAYDRAAEIAYGEFARLNFPKSKA